MQAKTRDCRACGQPYRSLAQHRRYCREVAAEPPLPFAPVGDENRAPNHACNARFEKEDLKRKVSEELLDIEIQHQLSHSSVCAFRGLLNTTVSEVYAGCNSHGDNGEGDRDDEDDEEIWKALEPFEDPTNWRAEDAEAKAKYPFIRPKVTVLEGNVEQPLSKRSYVSFTLIDLIHRRLMHDKAFRLRTMETSKRLRKGDKHMKALGEQDEIVDMLDGMAARFHPKLHAPSDDENELRLGGLLQVDDVEVSF
jgi:hypothetical protein